MAVYEQSNREWAADLARVTADLDTARAEVARLQDRVTDYEDDHRAVVAGQCAPDEVHCSCVPHLRREVARLTEERDADLAEVEAMRAVVGLVDTAIDKAECTCCGGVPSCDHGPADEWQARAAFRRVTDALDALRTRKGGG